MSQQSQVEEEFNTSDRGEVDSIRGKIERELGEPHGHSKEYQGPKEFQTPKVLPGYQECLGSQALQSRTNVLAFKPFQVLKYEVILEEGNNNV